MMQLPPGFVLDQPQAGAAAPRGSPQPLIRPSPPPPPPPNPGVGFRLNPDNTASPIPGSAADPNNPQTAGDSQDRRWQRVQSLRREFDGLPMVREFNAMRDSVLQLRRLGQNQSAQSDIAMVYNFMRSLDPTSAVRETEYATAQNAAGVPDVVRNYFNQLIDGRRLNPEQRESMQRVATDLYMSRARSYNQVAERYAGLFRELGEDPYRHLLIALGPEREDARARGENPDAPVERRDINGNVIPTLRPGETVQFGLDPAPLGSPWTEAQQQAYDRFMRDNPRASALEIDRFMREQGTGGVSNADEIVRHRDAGGSPAAGAAVIRPPVDISDARSPEGGLGQSVDAYGRATANTVLAGIPDRIAAAGDTLTSGGTYEENLRRQRAITSYDWENHPYASTAGTVTGALMVPSGAAAAGRSAATGALRSGLGRVDALSAASSAVGRRLAGEGAAYGAVQGLTEPDENAGFMDRLLNSGINAAMGGGISGVIGRYAPGPSARVPSSRPALVDPVTGRLNTTLENATPPERVGAANAFGINLPMGSAGGRTAALLEKGLDILPGSAGVMEAGRSRLRGAVDQAVEGLASLFGASRNLYDAGTAAQRGARDWISRFEEASDRAYRAIPISDAADSSLANTRGALDELTSRFQSNPELAETFRNTRLEQWRDALSTGRLSWRDLQDFRSEIGAKIGEQRFSEDPGTAQLRRLYAALSEDMRATAAAQGPRALRAFERANNLYRDGQQRIENALVRLLGDDARTNPEAAARSIQSMIGSGRGSPNINTLREIRASMTGGARGRDEWNEVSSTVFNLMGQPANSSGREFNPGTFVRNYADMSDDARNVLFSDRRGLRQALDEFVGVMQRLDATNALRNTSNTAPGITSAGTVAGLVSAPFNLPLAAKIGAVMAGAYGSARLWTNPAVVRWLTGYARAASGTGGGVGSMGRRRDTLLRLARINPTIAVEIQQLGEALLPSPENGDGDRSGTEQ